MRIRLSYFDEDANPDPTPHQSNANLAICDHWYTDPERRYFEPPQILNFDFNADPDPAFDFHTDPNPAFQSDADPDPAS